MSIHLRRNKIGKGKFHLGSKSVRSIKHGNDNVWPNVTITYQLTNCRVETSLGSGTSLQASGDNAVCIKGDYVTLEDGSQVNTQTVICTPVKISSGNHTIVDGKNIKWNRNTYKTTAVTAGYEEYKATYGNAVYSGNIQIQYNQNKLSYSISKMELDGNVGTSSKPVSASGQVISYTGGDITSVWTSGESGGSERPTFGTYNLTYSGGTYDNISAYADSYEKIISIPSLGTTPTQEGYYVIKPTNNVLAEDQKENASIKVYQEANTATSSYSPTVGYAYTDACSSPTTIPSGSYIPTEEDNNNVYIYAKVTETKSYTTGESTSTQVSSSLLGITLDDYDGFTYIPLSDYNGYKCWKLTVPSSMTSGKMFRVTVGDSVLTGGFVKYVQPTYSLSLTNSNAVLSGKNYTIDVASDVSSYQLNIYSTKNDSPYVGSSCIGVSASNSANTVTPGSATGSNYPVNVGFAVNTSTSESKSNLFTVTQKYNGSTKNEFDVNIRQSPKSHEYGFGINYGSDLIYEVTTPLAYNIKAYTIAINSTKDGVALQPSTSWISLNGNILSSSGISISHPADTPEGFYNIAFNCNVNNTDNVRDTVVTITQKDGSASTGKVITYTIHQQKRPTIELSTTAVSKSYSAQSGTITVGGISLTLMHLG